jgi:hypothetical protein
MLSPGMADIVHIVIDKLGILADMSSAEPH